MSPYNDTDKVVGVTYDGEWTVSFILPDDAGRPAKELPVRVGRGVADFLRELIQHSGDLWIERNPDGSWSAKA